MDTFSKRMTQFRYDIATSVKYGNYKQYKPIAVYGEKFAADNAKIICRSLKLPSEVFIKCRPIRGDAAGLAWKAGNIYFIEIDPRTDHKNMCSVLLHELVHIEQFFCNKLESLPGMFAWKGKTKPALPIDDTNYSMQPWEREADLKAAKIMERVKKEL